MPPKKSNLSLLKSAVNQYNNSVSKCQVVLNGKKYDKYESTLTKLEDKLPKHGRFIRKKSLKKGRLKQNLMH